MTGEAAERGRRGVHHVTAIAGDPDENVRFYRDVLGLRLLKWTVNHDDPGTHHLYYGDGAGRTGSTLTFFPWPRAPRGRQGRSQVGRIGLAAPPGSLDFWSGRLRERGVEVSRETVRGGTPELHFADPDGLALGIAEAPVDPVDVGWDGPVRPDRALRGVRGVELASRRPEATRRLLAEVLGLERDPGGSEWALRGREGDGEPGRWVELVPPSADVPGGRMGVGTVHHVAWRTPDEESQEAWRAELQERGMSVTPPVDRFYFRSVYFREPGGILFEVATEGPGFTRDEPLEELGSGLRLPPWLEDRREEIEGRLSPLETLEPGG